MPSLPERGPHLAQTFDPDEPVAAGIWLAVDVRGCAEQPGVPLGDDDVARILVTS